MVRVAVASINRLEHSGLSRFGLIDEYSVFGIHLGQNRDGKQGRLGILLSLTVVKSAVTIDIQS
jgi:hypothetical protein